MALHCWQELRLICDARDQALHLLLPRTDCGAPLQVGLNELARCTRHDVYGGEGLGTGRLRDSKRTSRVTMTDRYVREGRGTRVCVSLTVQMRVVERETE